MARQPVGGEHLQFGEKVGAADAGDVDPWILQGVQQGTLAWFEEVEALDGLVLDLARLCQPVEGTDASGEIIQCGEMGEIAPIAAEQNFAQVDQAVDAFLDGSQFAGWWSFPVFHLAVVLEKRNVVGGGLDAQHDAALVVHLDRGFAEAMLHACALDAGGKLRADLLSQLRGDVAAEEVGDLLGFDVQHGLANELVIERR